MPLALVKTDKKSRLPKYEPTDARDSGDYTSASKQTGQAASSVGDDLKTARLGKQVTLQQIVSDTHISLRHLQNLEEGNFGDLPGGMYNRAFLRSYCLYLGLEPEGFLERFERESAANSEKPLKLKPPSSHLPPQRSFRIPPVLIWSGMLLASLIGIYFSRGWISAVFSPYFSQPPASPLVKMPPESKPETKPADIAPAGIPPTTATITPPVTEPAPVLPPTQAPATEAAPAPIHLEFQGVQDCWMSVTSDGSHIASDVLHAGKVQTFDAKERVYIILGNAGGVSLKINGKQAKPLGKSGEVVKLLITLQTIPDLLEKLGG
jgi:cytoskeletal protein RodZ